MSSNMWSNVYLAAPVSGFLSFPRLFCVIFLRFCGCFAFWTGCRPRVGLPTCRDTPIQTLSVLARCKLRGIEIGSLSSARFDCFQSDHCFSSCRNCSALECCKCSHSTARSSSGYSTPANCSRLSFQKAVFYHRVASSAISSCQVLWTESARSTRSTWPVCLH